MTHLRTKLHSSIVIVLACGLLAALSACDSGGSNDTASVDGDVKVTLEGPPDTRVGLSVTYFDAQGLSTTAENVTLTGTPITRDLEDGHAGYRVTASPNPTTADLTLTLTSDGATVDTDSEGTTGEFGLTTFVVEGGETRDVNLQ